MHLDQCRSIPQAWYLVIKNSIGLEGVSCCSRTYKSVGISPIILGRGKSDTAKLTVLQCLVRRISLTTNLMVSIDFQNTAYIDVPTLHNHRSSEYAAILKDWQKVLSLFFSVKDKHIKPVRIYTCRPGNISCMRLDSVIQSWLLFKLHTIFYMKMLVNKVSLHVSCVIYIS